MADGTPPTADPSLAMKFPVLSVFAAVAFVVLLVMGVVVYRTPASVNEKSTPQVPSPPATKPTPVSTAVAPDPAKEEEPKEAEALPPAPKLSDKNELKELNKEKTLFVEMAPDPADPTKKKAVRVMVAAEVCLREGPLEVLLCKKNTKEHEAIVRTDVDARFIHAALVATGAKPGSPVRFVDPKTGEADYKPATGAKTKVTVHYTRGGKTFDHPAQEWILDRKTKKPMAYDWVFAGSRFVKNPEKPDDEPPHYCANNGEVVAISNFVDSMLDVPVEVGKNNDQLDFAAVTEKIPAIGSKVWVIFEAEPQKK